jgi:membrane-associated phospholipid phosphatase
MFLTYVSVWVVAYVCFLLYPTAAPRPAKVTGEGFAIWGLQFLYSSDPPYNCFPSLHVAHSVVSALMCHRINRRVGFIAFTCAALVAVSTLFTKQHYVLDVVAGALMACAAHLFFFRDVSRERITEVERLLAPIFATAVLAVAGVGLAAFWIVYQLR